VRPPRSQSVSRTAPGSPGPWLFDGGAVRDGTPPCGNVPAPSSPVMTTSPRTITRIPWKTSRFRPSSSSSRGPLLWARWRRRKGSDLVSHCRGKPCPSSSRRIRCVARNLAAAGTVPVTLSLEREIPSELRHFANIALCEVPEIPITGDESGAATFCTRIAPLGARCGRFLSLKEFRSCPACSASIWCGDSWWRSR
jgi:hypothetical protein